MDGPLTIDIWSGPTGETGRCYLTNHKSSGITANTSADKRISQALRNLLCGALWLWTICFYCVGLGHMFLLCGARPYVSIVWRSVAVDHMFLLCGARPYVSIVCVCVCVTICFHRLAPPL